MTYPTDTYSSTQKAQLAYTTEKPRCPICEGFKHDAERVCSGCLDQILDEKIRESVDKKFVNTIEITH